MDVKELFDDNQLTRGEMFYGLCKALEDLPEEALEKLLADVLKNSGATEEEVENLAIGFSHLRDQYEAEEEYKEKIIEPAEEAFNKIDIPFCIKGFD